MKWRKISEEETYLVIENSDKMGGAGIFFCCQVVTPDTTKKEETPGTNSTICRPAACATISSDSNESGIEVFEYKLEI